MIGNCLSGIRVLAFEQAVSMPYCSFILAEMGADVIKVERPGRGDVVRGWDSAARGISSGFVWLNAGKRDITVDARTAEGREIIMRLAAESDVFVENFAPGVVQRLGLDAETLRAQNSRLIYCSLSGYGQDGPYRDVKAYDLLIQGESGIIASTGYPDLPAKVGIPVADLVGGVHAAMAVLMALYQRHLTGEGQTLDVSMFEGMVSWLGYYPHHVWHGGSEPPRTGMRHQYICPYGPYLAADGQWVNLVVADQSSWERFCTGVIDRPEWITDPRFSNLASRSKNREAMEALVEAVIARESSETWKKRLAQVDLPYGDVRSVGEVLDHPQTEARRLIVNLISEVGELNAIRFPLADPERPRRLPSLGGNSGEVLRSLGYADSEIERLRTDGVI